MSLRHQFLTSSAFSALIACAFIGSAHANPTDGTVTAGVADITSSGKTLDITQHSDKAIIDWRGFDIAPDDTTNFVQPGSNSITVNRVHSNSASQIDGHLNANGNVVIINQNGIVFGAGAQVDVHGLVATTGDTDNDRFMNDAKVHFDLPCNTSASVINNGTITAHDAGLVGFVAPNVENHGVITAKMGRVHMAAGDKATVDFYGDGLMEVEAGDTLQNEVVTQTGTIDADGGTIALTAAAGGQVVSSLINAQGTIHAQSVSTHNGEIIIGAGKTGRSQVKVSGTVDASSTGGKGGKITVTADHITLENTATLNASGLTGGGTVKVGGDAHGQGVTATATTVQVKSGAKIKNNAVRTGDGGETIVWSDGYTDYQGYISGTGGAEGGNGGFVEVSGKDVLNYDGFADLEAGEGYEFGTLLLDPADITISSGSDSGGSFTSGTYTASGATSVINVSTLQSQIVSANVTISTSGGTGGNGDITVANALTFSTNSRTLTLNADRDIVFNAAAGWTANNGAFVMTATRDINLNANVTASAAGQLNVTAGRNLTIGTGVVVKNGSTGTLILKAAGGTITNTGVLTNNGTISAGTGSFTLASGLDSSTGTRADLTLNSTNLTYQGANIGAVSITGFKDVAVNRSLVSTAGITVNAEGNLTIGSGVAVTAASTGALSLKAASTAGITGTGIFTNGGTITAATGSFTLQSGVDGSGNRADLTLNGTNMLYAGATIGTTSVTGFKDVSVNRGLVSTAGITVNAEGNLTIGSGVAVTAAGTGAVSLKASSTAGINGTGVFTNGGTITGATGTFTLQSGVNGTGGRNDLTLNSTNLLYAGATLGAVTITGFKDVNVNRTLTDTAGIAISAEGNLTIASGVAVTAGGSGALSLKASSTAGVNGTGIFTNGGTLTAGTGAFTLQSGVDGTGARTDLTLNGTNLSYAGASVAAVSITGFRDTAINRTLTSSSTVTITSDRDFSNSAAITSGAASAIAINATTRDIVFGADVTSASGGSNITAQAGRNFTVNSGTTVKAGTSGAITLKAAGGLITNTGVLAINGILNLATSGTTLLLSGLDSTSAITKDLVLNSSLLTLQGATVGGFTINGYRDIAFAQNLSFASATNVVAERNLSVNSGVTLTTASANSLTLKSAGGVTTNLGQLAMNGIINAGSSILSLSSGQDSSGAYADLTLDGTNLTMQGATIGNFTLAGFRDIAINRVLNSTGTISIVADRDFTTSASMMAGSGATYTLTAGRDMVLGANVAGSGGTTGVVAQAGRNLTVNSGVILTPGSTGLISLKAAGGLTGNTGVLNMNGVMNVATGTLTLVSGLDSVTGNRNDLTLTTSNMTMQGATVGAIAISGFRDLTVNRTLGSTSTIAISTDRDFVSNAAIASPTTSTMSFTSGRDLVLTADVTGTGVTSPTLTFQAGRDLTVNSGVTIRAGNTGNVSLKAAGGVTTNSGILTLNGVINAATGAFTLLSGLDTSGNRADLALTSSNMTLVGANIGVLTLSGFRDIAINRALTTLTVAINADRDFINNAAITTGANYDFSFTTGRDMVFAADLTGGTGSGGITALAGRNLTVNSGVRLTPGTTGVFSLKSAGGVAGNTGVVAINGIINMSTGAFTLQSGLNSSGSSVDLDLNSGNMLMQGASIATTTISGFRDITLNRALTSSATTTITADRDLVFAANYAGLTGSAHITAQAGRNLTVNSGATLKAGTTGSISLKAAGGVVTNQGALVLNGVINATTGNYTLSSGLDSSGNATSDLSLDSSNLTMVGATVGNIAISGFRDININRAVNSTGTITLTSSRDININAPVASTTTSNMTFTAGRDMVIGGDMSLTSASTSDFVMLAGRNLTLNAGVTMKPALTGAINLKAAGGVITNQGVLTINGLLNAGTGTVTLLSGLDSSNARTTDLNINSGWLNYQNPTLGAMTITGFRDITFARSLVFASSVNVTAERNLIVNTGVNLTSGPTQGISIRAAGGLTTNTGLLILDGNVTMGPGTLTLLSGLNPAGGNRADITINDSNFTTSTGALAVSGYRDITLAKSINAGVTALADRNLTINSGVVLSSPTATFSLRAANAVITNTGQVYLNGVVNLGTGSLTLTSGLDSSGNRQDITIDNNNLQVSAANIGALAMSGYRDITLARDLTITAASTIMADRNLTVASGTTLTTNTSTYTLRAAGNIIANQGYLNLNGTIAVTGAGAVTLVSGLDSSNTRRDLTLNGSNFVLSGPNMGALSITGFRDVTLDRDITIGGTSTITAERNLTLATGRTLTTNVNTLSLKSAGGVIANTGQLLINGNLTTGVAAITLSSGLDSAGVRNDLVLNDSNFTVNGTTGAITITGFRDLTFAKSIAFGSTFSATAERNLNVNTGVTLTSGASSSITLRAAGNVVTNTGLLNMNGTLRIGTGGITLTSGVDGSGNRNDFTLNSGKIAYQGALMGGLTLSGYRDVVLNNFNGSGINVVAQRNLTINAGQSINTSGTGGVQLSAAGGATTNTGVLSLNGSLNALGSGVFTLVSGLDGNGVASNDLILNSANYTQGALIGTGTINGFRDITIDAPMISSGAYSMTAGRNLTITSNGVLTMGTTSSILLRSASGLITNTGVLTNNGVINAGNGTQTFLSGVNSSGGRDNLTLDPTHYVMLGGTIGALTISGYQDITLDRNLNSSSNILLTAERNLTINAGKTITAGSTGSISLNAGGAATLQPGVFTNNGVITIGKGLTLRTGSDAMIAGNDFVWDNTHYVAQGSDIGGLNLTGFRDAYFNNDVTLGGDSTLTIFRDITIAGGTTMTMMTGDILRIQAANNDQNGRGVVSLLGNVALPNSGGFYLNSAKDSAGNREDIVWNNGTSHISRAGTLMKGLSLTGFRDITIASDALTSYNLQFIADRNLTINSGVSISAVSNHSTRLTAAGGDINREGVVINNGMVYYGGVGLTFSSGLDASGNRVDFIMDSAHYTPVVSTPDFLSVQGFRDVDLEQNIFANQYIDVSAVRNLTLGTGVTMQSGTGYVSLRAANGMDSNTGVLNLNGTVKVGSGYLVLNSGLDANTALRKNLTVTTTNVQTQGPDIQFLTMTGFGNLDFQRSFASRDTIEASASTGGKVTLSAGTVLSAANDIDIAAAEFVNNSGAGALTSSGGRWVIYSNDPTTSQFGGLVYDFRAFNCSFAQACGNLPGSGNGFAFANNGNLEVVAQYRAATTSLPSTVISTASNPPLTSSAQSMTPIIDVSTGNFFRPSDYHQQDFILTFSPELADQYDLKNWDF